MFKFTIVVLALAVSAALAVNIQDFKQQRQPTADASHVVEQRKQRPDKVVYVSEPSKDEGSLIESGLSGLLTIVGLPKKVLGAVVGFLFGKIRSLGVTKLLKIALVAGLITVLGAIASVVAVSVAGLVSVVSGFCAGVFYFFGGGGGDEGGYRDAEGQASELKLESISDFVMSAFNKFESLEKA